MMTNGNEERPLPEGWSWATASEICSSVRDGTHDTPKYVDEGVPLITSKNLRPNGLSFEKIRFISFEDHDEISKRSAVARGDVLFAMIGTIGNPVVVQTDEAFSIKNVGLFKKNLEAILPEYLKYWLESWDLNQILQEKELIKGTTQRFIPLGHLRILPVPLAPMPEQKLIVAEVEKQFTRLDQAVASLKRAQANLRRYKASVLKAACEGRLVAQDPDDEPAEKLLERILAERRVRWEEQEWQKLVIKAQKKVAQTRRKAASRPARLSDLQPEEWQNLPEADYARYLPKNDKWKEKYKEPVGVETAELPVLPEGWVWATIDQLASGRPRSIQSGPFGSSLLHSEFQDTGILALGIDNVLEMQFSMGSEHRISQDKYFELRKYTARPLDVLITVMATVGRCCVVPDNLETAIITKHVYRISVNTSFISPSYLMYSLSGGSEVRRQMFGNVRGQTRPGINGTILKGLAIPVPPLLEQKSIIDEIERRLSVIAANEKAIAADLARAERLRQSILQQAFSGQLVPQEASLTS